MKIVVRYMLGGTICTDTIKTSHKHHNIDLFPDGRAIIKTRTDHYLYANCQRIHITGIPKDSLT